jgi:epsilon-lactone hydrolase
VAVCFALIGCIICGSVGLSGAGAAADSGAPDAPSLQLPAVSLPQSSLLGDDTRAALKQAADRDKAEPPSWVSCPSIEAAHAAQAQTIRKCQNDGFLASRLYQQIRARYAVTMTTQVIGGITTDIFVPVEGVSTKNQKRVLINLHGGGFMYGSRFVSKMESIPIASVGKFKVISVDYREAPEFGFPAASEDVAAVYRELLKTYKPKNIAIYGCSAGGLLTAETVAWLQKLMLPRPGAVGMFCEGADYWTEGDSGALGKLIYGGMIWGTKAQNPYFKATDTNDPLAFPGQSISVMSKFPPSLLISGSRDPALSSVVHTHAILVSQGVEAALHVWEGMGHAFFFDPGLPESREVYAVIAEFFDQHLGRD